MSNVLKQTLNKKEILRGKKVIDGLFEKGKGYIQYPLRSVYIGSVCDSKDRASECEALFVVGKRYSKRAVRRNKIRRRMKEAYRLNKSMFKAKVTEYDIVDMQMAFLYVGKEECSFDTINISMQKILSNVVEKIKKHSTVTADSAN